MTRLIEIMAAHQVECARWSYRLYENGVSLPEAMRRGLDRMDQRATRVELRLREIERRNK